VGLRFNTLFTKPSFQMHRLSNQNTSIDYQEEHKNNEIRSFSNIHATRGYVLSNAFFLCV